MAKVIVDAGICGFKTTIRTRMEGDAVRISLVSDCPAIEALGKALPEVDPYKEISARRAIPKTLEAGLKHCTHAACPVPAGIIKAVEVAAGLALPRDAHIEVSADD